MARFDGGWVKLHRKAALGDINANYTRGGLFTALLAMANIQNSTVSWRGKPKTLERGEVVTSLRELADLGEVDRSTVMRHLGYLELRGTIKLEKSNRGILVTILNYSKYQDVNANGPHQAQQQPHFRHNIGRTHNEELKNKRKKEPKPKSPKAPLHPLATLWNENVKTLARVKKTEEDRLESCKAKWEDYSGEEWGQIFRRADKSKFLCGGGNKGWWATFDWVIENANRIDEGEFDNRGDAASNSAFCGVADVP